MHCWKKISVLGHDITIDLYDTKAGINILIEGGKKGHIGAVAIGGAGEVTALISFPSHKEGIVCGEWAKKISAVYQGPVVVEAGVHYDNITKEQIQEVLKALDQELDCLIKNMESEGTINDGTYTCYE